MNEFLEFKKRVVLEFMRRKKALLDDLKEAQRNQWESAQSDDIDFADRTESPREQIMDEVALKVGAIDFVAYELKVLESIQEDIVHEAISQGALVQTSTSYFLIGVAHEQFTFENKPLVGISKDAPIFQKMHGLKRKSRFSYGNTEYVILNVV
jgi:hypothetical protein